MTHLATIPAFYVPVVFDDYGASYETGPRVLFDAGPAVANWDLADLLGALAAGDRSHWLCTLLPQGQESGQQYDVVAVDAIGDWLAGLGFPEPEQITPEQWASLRQMLGLLAQLR